MFGRRPDATLVRDLHSMQPSHTRFLGHGPHAADVQDIAVDSNPQILAPESRDLRSQNQRFVRLEHVDGRLPAVAGRRFAEIAEQLDVRLAPERIRNRSSPR